LGSNPVPSGGESGLGSILLGCFGYLIARGRAQSARMQPERMRMYQAAEQLVAEVEILLPRAKN
jgi:hypothetical protein